MSPHEADEILEITISWKVEIEFKSVPGRLGRPYTSLKKLPGFSTMFYVEDAHGSFVCTYGCSCAYLCNTCSHIHVWILLLILGSVSES